MVQMELRPIRDDIETRLTRLSDRLQALHSQRDALLNEIHNVEGQVAIWREAFRLETPAGEAAPVPEANVAILSMPISEAVDHLRRQNMGMTKDMAQLHLETIGFDFKGKRPKAAMHFAWLNSNRRKENQNGRDPA